MREWSLSTRHGAIVQPPRASWHPPVLEMVEALHKEAVGERVDALEVLVPDQLHGARGWVKRRNTSAGTSVAAINVGAAPRRCTATRSNQHQPNGTASAGRGPVLCNIG